MTASPQELIGPAIPAMTWTVLSTGVGALLAAVVGILWLQGRRVPGAVGALPVLAPALIGLGLAWEGPTVIAVGTRLILPLAVGGPLALLAMFGALATVARPPRSPTRAAAGAVCVFATAGVVIGAGYALDDQFFAWFRAVVYGVVGLLCLPSLAAPDSDDRPGGEAAAAVGAGYALFVASGETAARALAEFIAIGGAASHDVVLRATILERFVTEVITPTRPWSAGAVITASAMALVGASAAGGDPKRIASAGSAVMIALAGLAFWFVAGPSAVDLLAAVPR